MITKLIFLYDSTIEPWQANVDRIKTQLANLKERGIDCEVIDTASITEDELDNWRDKAYVPSVRWKLRIRQVFGSRSRGGLPTLVNRFRHYWFTKRTTKGQMPSIHIRRLMNISG